MFKSIKENKSDKMRFITNEPAVVLDGTLVIGDLHIGIETDFYRNGFSFESSGDSLRQKILKIARENNCKKLVLLGDVKNDYHGLSWQEERELPVFLGDLSRALEVHVAIGNHDGNLKDIAPKEVAVHGSSGFIMGGNFFAHGHSWPDESFLDAERVFLGHNHPAIEFRDKLGYRHVEPCWLRCGLVRKKVVEKYGKKGKVKEVIYVPVFNPLLGGLPVNRSESELGPLMKNGLVERKKCDVYLLDGTLLGKVKDIKS